MAAENKSFKQEYYFFASSKYIYKVTNIMRTKKATITFLNR